MKINIYVIILVFCAIHGATGLKCYACSATEDDADTSCLDNLSEKNVLDCDKKYCYVVRIDYKGVIIGENTTAFSDPRGKLQSLSRTCLDKPAYTNEVIEDETHRSYYRACRSDLCNDGNGRTDSSTGETGAFGAKSTIYVPGTGTNKGIVAQSFLFVNVVGIVALYLWR